MTTKKILEQLGKAQLHSGGKFDIYKLIRNLNGDVVMMEGKIFLSDRDTNGTPVTWDENGKCILVDYPFIEITNVPKVYRAYDLVITENIPHTKSLLRKT